MSPSLVNYNFKILIANILYILIVQPAAHACYPSYSGGRDQEDQGSKPAQGNSSCDPILKKPFTKKGLVEWLKVKA
jgi:hypothetical protein